MSVVPSVRLSRRVRFALWLWVFALFGSPLLAKEAGLAGVLVYKGASGPAYVQFTGLLINGKLELKTCAGTTLDKSSYKNAQKIKVETLKGLERLPDGSLQALFAGAEPKCVIPGNFKFDKDGTMTMSDLVDKSTFTAQVVGSQPAGESVFPVIAPGSRLTFVLATDVEMAEYLRADWANTMPQWRTYLASYGNSPHTAEGKKSLQALLLTDGQAELATYKKSKGPSPSYADLKAVRDRTDELVALDPKNAASLKLQNDLHLELEEICATGTAKLQLYRQAVTDQTKGYVNLTTAKTLSEAAISVDAKYPAAITLQSAVAVDANAFENTLKDAQTKLNASRYDEAYETVKKYLAFQEEEPRVKAVVQSAYKYHMDHGAQMVSANRWAEAVGDYRKANDFAATDASKSALAKALAGQQATLNDAAAKAALAKSGDYVTAKDFIRAYEVLADLTPDQRKLVAEQMEAAEPAYLTAATDMARKLQQTHSPIRGRADEDANRQAYSYLERVDRLSDNPDVKVRIDLLSDTLSAYYVTLGKKYLDKPVASGVGVGVGYLTEASQYRPGLPSIRDAMATANLTYQMRSKLSVGVVFRDQTSRRDSVGFAEQLQDAIATGIETSKLPVRVIRPGATTASLEPNYQLVGEILQHRTIKTVEPETLKSNYRSGERDVPNDAWNKADTEFEDAQAKVQIALTAQTAASAKGNKKALDDANAALSAAQQRALDARSKMNMTPKMLQEDVIRPYNYLKQTISLTNIVELSFRIIDASGNTVEESTHIIKQVPRKFTVLQNVKPDDTEGVHELDSPPDETQLLTDVEIAARDELVKLAHDKVEGLPAKILTAARTKSRGEDSDAAAELYILYLNSTPAKETPERAEATRFLMESYNLRHAGALSAATQ